MAASAGNLVRIWETANGSQVKEIVEPFPDGQSAWALAFSADSQYLAGGSAEVPFAFDKRIRVWNAKSGEEITDLLDGPGGVRALAFSPDGELAAASFSSSSLLFLPLSVPIRRSISLWDLALGRSVQKFKGCGSTDALAFSPDGRLMAAACGAKLCLWDVKTAAIFRKIPTQRTGWSVALAFSQDGKTLAFVGADNTVRVWALNMGQEIRGCTFASEGARGMAFSAGGHLLAFGDQKLTMHVWDVDSCVELLRFRF